MKALVLKAYMDLKVEDVPKPEAKADEVLIRVRACGICGSDVHGMDGSTGRRIPPIVMGHEAAGEIVEVGSGVSAWKAGDRVTFDSTIYCGSCWHCKRGEVNLCENRRVVGVSCQDYRQNGAFAEFIAVPERILYLLPDGVSFEQAALVEAVSVAAHAVGRSPVKSGCSAMVVGSGMIGLLVIQILKAKGCAQIFAVDPDPERLALASRFGATTTLDSGSADVAGTARRLASGMGVDVAFEAVGLSATLKTALDSTRKGGSVVLVGNLSPIVDLPLQSVVTREITLLGTCASAGEYPECMRMIADGTVDVSAFLSAVAPLRDGASWFNRLHSREKGLMKVLLAP
ncbi:MAG TPA: galactitol-1-phosphate 5-dehydrogenase [Opitutaceae bacterium]|nr:galactitol-1-phosphate 5-dehydrogenase [Opitutaceae bacterium]